MNLVLMSVSLCEQVWFLLLVMILNYKRSSVDDTKLELYLCIYAIVICFVQLNSLYQIRFFTYIVMILLQKSKSILFRHHLSRLHMFLISDTHTYFITKNQISRNEYNYKTHIILWIHFGKKMIMTIRLINF